MVIRTVIHINKTPLEPKPEFYLRMMAMVRKGGFEPPRLSAPPPQDGVSASSTTSAAYNLPIFNNLTRSAFEGVPDCTGFCTDLLHSTRISGRSRFPSRVNNLST